MRIMSAPSRDGMKIRLLAATALAAGFAFPAFAQQAAQPAPQAAAQNGGMEEIVGRNRMLGQARFRLLGVRYKK